MKITVAAGPHTRKNAVCSLAIPGLPAFEGGRARLVPEKGEPIPASIRGCGEATELTFVLDYLGANETMAFSLEPSGEAAAPRMRAEQTDRGVTFSDGGAFVTEYYTGTDIPKPYLGPLRERYGADVTRLDFEIREHPHHRALWVSHGDVNGVDTWNEPAGTHGFIRNNRISGVYCGDALAAFTAENTWTDHEGGKLLDETTEYKLYAVGAVCTVVDVCIVLTAAYGEVTLGSTKEAGPLAVRMAESIKVRNTGTMKNGVGGINEGEIWMKRAPWVDYYGLAAGRVCGIAMLDHPQNDLYPSYWHARDYGLMAVNNFFVGGERKIPAGEKMTFRYRIVVHNGDTETAGIADMFADYAAPVKVTAEQ